MKDKTIKELETEIEYHNQLYWKENRIEISDIEYDKLTQELRLLDPTNELLNDIHDPILEIGEKVYRDSPMLSMEKVYNYEDLIKWCKKISRSGKEIFKIEPKYDGVSGYLENGVLSTRGDGYVGENITNKLPLIKIIKNNTDTQNARGEILFTKSDFKKYRSLVLRKDGSEYKNERNAVGGILNRDDINYKVGPILTLIDFETNYKELTLEQIEEFNENGKLKELEDQIFYGDYPADGIVFKISDKEYAKSLGFTSHHLKSEMALKFTNPFEFSKLVNINWSCGKHTITPIGEVEPVEVSGIVIVNVNLHNMKNIRDMDIHIGDLLKIERAGDVIPFVTDIEPGEKRTFIDIKVCPCCGHEVIYEDPEIVCSNPNCSGKHLMRLMDSVVRIGIDRLGLPTLRKMVDTLGVYDLIDIFRLHRDDIIRMEGFAETSANNLFNEIQKVRKNGVFEWQILSSLNLIGIGKTLSKDLLKEISLEELQTYNVQQLKYTVGVGEERAQVLYTGLKENEKFIEKLLTILLIKRVVKEKKKDMMKICFTGKFPEKKSYYYDLIKDKYDIVEKITKDLDILVVADPSKKTSKQVKAEKEGIKTISISELLEKVV